MNVTNYENLHVYNNQLKQIYETVEVKDFQRILNLLYDSDHFYKHAIIINEQEDKLLNKIYLTNIYEKSFGDYINYMKNVVANK